jgi:hypothetical protein
MTDTIRPDSTTADPSASAARRRTTVISAALLAALAIPSAGAIAVANAEPNSQQPAAMVTAAPAAAKVTAASKPAGTAQELTKRTPAAAKHWAKHFMRTKYGWGDAQYRALHQLWTRESNWSYKEKNASSGAYGIPQSLPAKKMATAGKDWKTNPQTQIEWGLRYIKRTYGAPTAAWAHSQANNWY